jgi:hypothetical protein
MSDKEGETANKQNPKFLNDLPVRGDKFAGKAHERAAKALVAAIKTPGIGGNAIGLEGVWGSGKSSVIEIAKNEFSEHGQEQACGRFDVFTFDMWAHQGDPLRRSFLEELLSWVSSLKLISEDEKNEIFKIILGRHKEITTKTRRTFSKSGIIFLLLAPILPIVFM